MSEPTGGESAQWGESAQYRPPAPASAPRPDVARDRDGADVTTDRDGADVTTDRDGADVTTDVVGDGEVGYSDGWGVAAVVVGVVGLLGGLWASILAAILAAESGRRARDDARPAVLAKWAFALAVVDAVLWLVLHMIFDFDLLLG